MARRTVAKKSVYTDMIMEHMPVGVAVYDAQNLTLLEANTLFLTILDVLLAAEWHDGRAIGHPITELGTQIQAAGLVDIFRSVAKTGISHRSESVPFYTANGRLTYWTWTLDAIHTSDGQIIHLLETITEVTPHAHPAVKDTQDTSRQANRGIEAAHKRLKVIEIIARSVRESMDTKRIGDIAIDAIRAHFHPRFISLHTADEQQQMLHLLCIRTPPHSEDIIHALQHVSHTSSFLMAQAYFHHQPIVIEDLQVAASTAKIASTHPMVERGMKGYVCIPLWFADRFEGTLTAAFSDAIRADGIEVSTLVGSGTHIAAALAQARLHRYVKDEHKRLHTVLDQLPEGILIAEAVNGTITYANPAAENLLGIALPRLLNTPISQFTPRFQSNSTKAESYKNTRPWNFFLIQALSGETIESKETLVQHPDATIRTLLTSGAPLYTEQGVMSEAVLVFQDITAQKSLEQQKDEFLWMANHELRTPITIIQGFADLLRDERDLSEPTHSALNNIVEQSEYLTRLIKAMMDMSSIEQEQFSLHIASHDLLRLLIQTVESQAITTTRHTLHLVLEGLEQHDTLPALFDKERIIQVISNLINNAIKYSPDGGTIEVGLRATPATAHTTAYREALLWVKDQGIGVASEEIPHIFKRFYRVKTIDSSLSGFGIGLYLVQEIITRHGGRVWVESNKAHGSTFYLALPLKTHETRL